MAKDAKGKGKEPEKEENSHDALKQENDRLKAELAAKSKEQLSDFRKLYSEMVKEEPWKQKGGKIRQQQKKENAGDGGKGGGRGKEEEEEDDGRTAAAERRTAEEKAAAKAARMAKAKPAKVRAETARKD